MHLAMNYNWHLLQNDGAVLVHVLYTRACMYARYMRVLISAHHIYRTTRMASIITYGLH